ncbi:MAG: AMP-binding protein [Synergistaceae bacterium]|nr:AMP-binding protein [Synergistaceae bacterium]
MYKFLLRLFFQILYRPKLVLQSLQTALATGERVILAPHHSSYMDPVLFSFFVPDAMTVVSPSNARQKWFRYFKNSFRHVVLDTNDPFAAKRINDLLKDNRFLIVFPEPEPTTTGLLMKISDAAVSAFEASGAWIVPARACNMQFTPFSRMGGRLVRVKAPRVTLFCGEAIKLGKDGGGGGNHSPRRRIEQMMNDVMALGLWDKKPLFDTLLEQRKLWGAKHVVAIEPDGTRTDWNRLLTLVFVMERIVEKLTKPGERIGIMLPNSVTTLAAIIGAQHADREPAMINYSMGARSMKEACGIAGVGVIVTSRRFVDEGKFQPLVDALAADGLSIQFLEDHVSAMSALQKLGCVLYSRFAGPTPDAEKYAERTAVVLFTSGSEGAPKPVALSFLNIQANTAQVRTVLDFYQTDVLVDIMPMFHSFGLCTGTIMPLSAGMPIAVYPTPLHYKKIPQFSYEARGTVLLATNVFLAGYGRSAEPFDFFEMRYVICGGDKLKESTSKLWLEKFGHQVLEGYGVTECSPVVGVNKKGRCKPGSIGVPLPCTETSLNLVEGVAEGGRLVLKGPNLMRGYIRADGSITPPPDEGYDTGDIVTIDEEGFITIIGRAKRFAKIGGEMVSLTYVEEAVQEVWPDEPHAVVCVSDEIRGEVIVMLTERREPDRDALRAELTKRGLPELVIPKKIMQIEALPRIGVGKIDYQAAAKIASE